MSKKALLMILDGWGIGDQGKDDVIFNTPTPTGILCWQTIRTLNCRLAVRTLVCPTDRWVTPK